MTMLPTALLLLGAVTLMAVVLDGRMSRRSDGARTAVPERSTWWLLLLIGLAGLGRETVADGEGRWWPVLAMAALGAALLRSVVLGARRRTVVATGAVPAAFVVLVGWLFAVNLAQNLGVVGDAVLQRGIAVVFWIGFALYVRLTHVSLHMVAKSAVALMAVVAVMTAVSPEPWRACDQFKCGPYGALLRGPFTSENLLAMLAAVCLLLLLAVGTAPWRWPAFAMSAVILSATSSRTTMLALGCAVAFWLLSSPRTGLGRSRRWTGTGYAAVVLSAHVVSAVLVLTAEQSTLSNRGRIWTRATEVLEGSDVLGLGLDRWAVLQSSGTLPPLFPHNQMLLVYFAGGAVAVVLYLSILLAPLGIRAGRSTPRRFVMSYGVYLSVVGLAEVFWNPLAIDLQVAVLAPFFALASVRSAGHTTPARRGQAPPSAPRQPFGSDVPAPARPATSSATGAAPRRSGPSVR